jgi:gluconokinase
MVDARRERVPVVIGLDVGTTSAKAMAFATDGAEVGPGAESSYPLLEPEHGRAEQDPDTVVRAATTVVRQAATAARDAGAEVAGISVSTAMHALAGLDGEGRPRGRAPARGAPRAPRPHRDAAASDGAAAEARVVPRA